MAPRVRETHLVLHREVHMAKKTTETTPRPTLPTKESRGRKKLESSHEIRRTTSAVRNPPPKRFSHSAVGNR